MIRTLFLSVLLSLCFSFRQDNRIPWTEKRKLAWEDFQGKPDASSPFMARTESNLDIQISTQGTAVTITMVTTFDKSKSWVKKKTDLLLKHEQTHFDIAELWSRKFKQRLKGKTFAAKEFQRTLQKMHADIQQESKAMQAAYDKETDHSVIEKVQDKWTNKINADLKSLSEFVPSEVTCKLSK